MDDDDAFTIFFLKIEALRDSILRIYLINTFNYLLLSVTVSSHSSLILDFTSTFCFDDFVGSK